MKLIWARVGGCIAVVCLVSVARGTVIHIPQEYPTIQAGINAAADNDTVLVADGTYTGDGNRDIDFWGKAIVVMSENGPDLTIIDCQGSWENPHRGFYFHRWEDSTSVVQGFTIRNGYVRGDPPHDSGGAILCNGSSPTIRGNLIRQSTSSAGGGIGCWLSSAIIIGNTIGGNTSYWSGGGIRYTHDSSPIIVNNIIAGNTAEERGGGIDCGSNPPATIMGNAIVGNTAWRGGGIHSEWSSPNVMGNTIVGNTAWRGGGFSCAWCGPIVTGNLIKGNTASWDGGGVDCEGQSLFLTGNTIAENAADRDGGGIHVEGTVLEMDRTTVTRNTAGRYGGGMSCDWFETVVNAIFWGNDAAQYPEIHVLEGSIALTYSDVQGGWPGEGNIDADPMFVLPNSGDCRLLWGSPCIDAGHPDSLDPDGTCSDMGAHFFDQDDYLTLYVTPDTIEVTRGGVLGVTYTVINRWAEPEPFWVLTQAILPNGTPFPVMGPDQYALPANHTEQRHLNHLVPGVAPFGVYGYWSRIGVPPSTLYDEDSFAFMVVGP